jgi:hypothetical protein
MAHNPSQSFQQSSLPNPLLLITPPKLMDGGNPALPKRNSKKNL